MPNEVAEHGLVLSKPRLKWTRQLHQRFADAVTQLGGADKATPKSVMRVMGIPGITLYHLKSHLQKYRLAKNRDHKVNNKNEDTAVEDYRPTEDAALHIDEHSPQLQLPTSRTMLQPQMEVQRKLQEQIEKHLQLRIEAQGKYLESVLRRAQETLASYSLNSIDMEAAKPELSELVSAVDTECQTCSLSQASSVLKQITTNADCSSERPESQNGQQQQQQQQQHNLETSDCSNNWTAESSETDPSYVVSEKVEMQYSGDLSWGWKRIRCLHQDEESNVFQEEIDLNR